jgi:hypothetical protein
MIRAQRLLIAALLVALAQAAAAGDPVADLNARIAASSGLGDKVKAFLKEKLIGVCTDDVLAKEVAAQNARKVTLAEIKKIDDAWQAAEDELPIHREVTSNTCAKRLRQMAKDMPAVAEVFVMDDQGAVVGENQLTSDYWQGDEAKWQKSFNGGKGGLDVGQLKLDRSSGVELQQVSLPVLTKDGKVIGAITFGLVPSRI